MQEKLNPEVIAASEISPEISEKKVVVIDCGTFDDGVAVEEK